MASQYESGKDENFWEQNELKRLQINKFECSRHPNPLPHSFLELGEFSFLHMSPLDSLFSILALWGNKKWPPSMKVEKMEIFGNNMSLIGCKWSSLNAPSTQNPLSHSFLEVGEFPFLHISPLG